MENQAIYEEDAEDASGRNREGKEVSKRLSSEEGGWRMSVKFDDFLQEQMQDAEFKKEYDELQPERAIMQAIVDARHQTGMTQKELSERTGIAQGDISKLEKGNANPSLKTLQRLAAGLGMTLRLDFQPMATK